MMRKILILILISNLWAQDIPESKVSSTMFVSVTISSSLELITLRDINIGTVMPSQIQVIVDPINDQGAGLIKVSGAPFTNLKLDFSQQVEMVNSITSGILLVKYSLSGSPTNEQNSSFQITEIPSNISLSDKGEYFLWVGCSFNLSNIEPGNYDGDFGIEVDYIN